MYLYYNENGYRIIKECLLEITYFFYEQDQLIYQIIESRVDGTVLHKIVYLYDEKNSLIGFNYDGSYYYYIKDIFNNINGIIDKNGTIIAIYRYNAYGEHEVCNSDLSINTDSSFIGNINPIRYKGYYYDVETQLYWVSSRYYNPEWGRWISPDSIEYLDPESINGLNLYAYCNNDPVNKYDPSGNFPFFILTAIIGAVIGVGITAAVDYIPDQEFDLHWGWYVGAGLLGAAIGAGIGMAISYYATGSIASSTGKVFSGLFGKTTLYRSVGPDELADIQKTGRFNLGNGSMEAKQFGLSLDETKMFGNWVNQSNIVSTKIPNRIFYRLDHTIVDVGIFKSGVVTVHSSMLSTFNNSLLGIWFL